MACQSRWSGGLVARRGRLARFAGLALGAALCAGCWMGRAPYSRLAPLSPQPATLADALPELERRWPEAATFQAAGDLVLSGESIRGKWKVEADLAYQAPDRLRFRASRFPLSTVFEILQVGEAVELLRSHDVSLARRNARNGAFGAKPCSRRKGE